MNQIDYVFIYIWSVCTCMYIESDREETAWNGLVIDVLLYGMGTGSAGGTLLKI